MKHIKSAFRSKALSHPVGGLRGRGQKPNFYFFQNTVMLHIKLKRTMNAATLQQIFCPLIPPPRPWGWVQEHGHVAYQISKFLKCSNMVGNILPAYPLPPAPTLGMPMGPIVQNSTLSEHGHVAFQN